jgi:hypothetical protein
MSGHSLTAHLNNARWTRRSWPFPHVVATDVFAPETYQALVEDYNCLLETPERSGSMMEPFRYRPEHDFYSTAFTPMTAGPFRLFISPWWHDLLAALFGVRATGDINGGLHHHKPGSRSGSIHSDFNPGWFITGDGHDPGPSRIRVSGKECNYQNGARGDPTLRAQERVRGVAMIYYLGNQPEWKPGNGGETFLYAGRDAKEWVAAPPINNSLLAFECTPYTFHAFGSNRLGPRSSVILWLHREKADAIVKWGGDRLIYWPA